MIFFCPKRCDIFVPRGCINFFVLGGCMIYLCPEGLRDFCVLRGYKIFLFGEVGFKKNLVEKI